MKTYTKLGLLLALVLALAGLAGGGVSTYAWTAPAALNTNAAVGAGDDESPQVTTDGAGNWVAVWYSTDSLGGTIGSDSDILAALALLADAPSYASTTVSGGIVSDTTWTAANSPYLVTGDVTLFPGYTLTIEPGVEVRFSSGTGLTTRGTLVAEGISSNRIVFTSAEASPAKGDWRGVDVANTLGGSASIRFADFSYASTAVSVACCGSGGPVGIYDTTFVENSTALGGYAGWDMTVERATFENNTYAVTSADKTITDSVFRNNDYGLFSTERVSVYNSTFEGNDVALFGGRGEVQSCEIFNNRIGVQGFFEGFTLGNNTITNNDVGVILTQYGTSSAPVENNNIYGNTTYDLKNTGAADKSVPNNWWGTTDAELIDQHIYDAYDDPSLGVVNYSPLLMSEGGSPNHVPTVSVAAYPQYGVVPLAVSFTGSASDSDGTIVLYEWDFEGDGTYDWSSTTTGDTAHTYSGTGTYTANFRVTDDLGVTKTVGIPIAAVNPGEAIPVSGSIFVDTTWPGPNTYLVTGDVTLFPGYTLTIDPGVEVRFSSGTGMTIRGALVAEGTSSNEIVFTSAEASPAKGDWRGVDVANTLGGSASIRFADFSYASTAVSVQCCGGGGPVEIYDSVFANNATALGGYAGWDMVVERATFENNTCAVTSADKTISDSVFRNNEYGLCGTERVSVYNSTFEGTDVALFGGRGEVQFCEIFNNRIGVQGFFEGFTLLNNTITNNDVGIILTQYGTHTPPVENNNIYGNTTYDLKNTGAADKSVPNNWWGTTDTAQIDAKIFDGYDDPTLGIVHYLPILTSPATGAPTDSDGDGVRDSHDDCPDTPPGEPVDASGCSQAQVDQDLDGYCDPSASSPTWCTGSDNCPLVANPDQADTDGDGVGDACDDCPDVPGAPENNGCPLCGDVNCDDDVDAVDALFILQYVVGTRDGSDQCPPPPGQICLPLSDADCDDDVDAVDALFVLQYVVGLRAELCVCPGS